MHWKDTLGGARVRGTVYVDGVRACGSVSMGYAGEVVDRAECMASATTSRALLFSCASTTGTRVTRCYRWTCECDAFTDDETVVFDAASVGVIRIKLSKVVIVGVNGTRKYSGVENLAVQKAMHERDKKLDSQCVAYAWG